MTPMNNPFSNAETAKQRLAICLNCEHLRPFIKQCARCGCFVLGKVRLEVAKCPEGKW
jgi:hypothetical protein